MAEEQPISPRDASLAALALTERLRSAALLLEKLSYVEDPELQAAIATIKRKTSAAAIASGSSAEPEPLAPDLLKVR